MVAASVEFRVERDDQLDHLAAAVQQHATGSQAMTSAASTSSPNSLRGEGHGIAQVSTKRRAVRLNEAASHRTSGAERRNWGRLARMS